MAEFVPSSVKSENSLLNPHFGAVEYLLVPFKRNRMAPLSATGVKRMPVIFDAEEKIKLNIFC